MAVNIYKNNAWTSITGVREYKNNAWQMKNSVKVYENGAWVDKWVSETKISELDKSTIEYKQTTHGTFAFYYKQKQLWIFGTGNSWAVDGEATFWAEGSFTNPKLEIRFAGSIDGWKGSRQIGQFSLIAGTSTATDYLYSDSSSAGGTMYKNFTNTFNGTFNKVGVKMSQITSYPGKNTNLGLLYFKLNDQNITLVNNNLTWNRPNDNSYWQ